MAPTLTLTPNITSYILGDAPITVSLSGGNTSTGPDFLWESSNGTFDNRFASSAIFIPNNVTNIVSIIGRMVEHTNFGSSPANISTYGTLGLTKSGGSTTSWDAVQFHATALPSPNGFYQVEAVEVNTEKAMGFLSNSAYSNPTTTNSDVNLTFALSWHLLANGTAIPRKAGVALANPVVYKAGDMFRITVEPSRILYSLNNVVVATTGFPTGVAGLYAAVSFKTFNGTLDNLSYFRDTTNEASTSISVSGLFPVEPNYTYNRDEDNNTLSSIAEDGSAVFRKKGRIKRSLALQFNERPYSEYLLISNFWRAHEKHQQFIYREFDTGEVYIMRFDAGLKLSIQAPDSVTLQVSLKEA
jgi:hypothetical protein